MSNILKYIITGLVCLLLGLFIGYLMGMKFISPQIITKEVTDTITVEKENIKTKTIVKYKTKIDTFYLTNLDTVYINDLPIEYKEYSDTLELKDSVTAYININHHGFVSEIDSLSLIVNTKKDIIIKKEPKKFGLTWTIGPYAGYGYDFMTGTWGVNAGICGSIGIGGMIK